MVCGSIGIIVAGITQAYAHNFRTVERTPRLVKAVLNMDSDDTVVISSHFTINGNGAEQNPSATVEITVDGNACETREVNWQDGPAAFDFTCTVALKKGTHGVTAREVRNNRATASSISISIKRAVNAGAEVVTF
jgi:hypothetical protein